MKTIKKTVKRPLLKNTGDNEIYDINIASVKDYLMEMAYKSLPPAQKKYQTGSGYCFFSGEMDHHFHCKGYTKMLDIVKHYKSVLPCKIYDYSKNVRQEIQDEIEEKAEEKAAAKRAKKAKKCPQTKKK